MHRAPGNVQADGPGLLLDVQVQRHVGPQRVHVGPFACLGPEKVGHSVLQAQSSELGMPDLVVARHVGEHGEGAIDGKMRCHSTDRPAR